MAKKMESTRHKNIVYFRNPEMDFYLQAIPLGYASYGGASVGEAFYAASRINEKDMESWINEWTALAKRVHNQADTAIKEGREITARQNYLRAFTYYRTASFVARVNDPRFSEIWQKFQFCFQRFSELTGDCIEQIDIPFEGNNLPGYFLKSKIENQVNKTLIIIGGGETSSEDLYFLGGAEASEHGYNVLLVDMPGQGGTPFQGMHHRYDVEIPMGCVLEYLHNRSDVNKEKIGIFGLSLGGYIVLRVASHDPRIKACAASTPIVDFHQFSLDGMPTALKVLPGFISDSFMKLAKLMDPSQLTAIEKFAWQVGVENVSDALESFKSWKVDISKITCPVLCILGDGEDGAFKTQTQICYDSLSSQKKLQKFSEEEGADSHCQANNVMRSMQVVCDWMDEIFSKQ